MAQKYGFNTRVLHGNPESRFADGSPLPPIAQVNAFAHSSAENHEAVFAATASRDLPTPVWRIRPWRSSSG